MTLGNHNFKITKISRDLDRLSKDIRGVIAEHQPFDQAIVGINYLIADLDRQLKQLEENDLLTDEKRYERQEETLAQIRDITMHTIEHRNKRSNEK